MIFRLVSAAVVVLLLCIQASSWVVAASESADEEKVWNWGVVETAEEKTKTSFDKNHNDPTFNETGPALLVAAPTKAEIDELPEDFRNSLQEMERMIQEAGQPDIVGLTSKGMSGVLEMVEQLAHRLDVAVDFFDTWEETGLITPHLEPTFQFLRAHFIQAREQTDDVMHNLTQLVHVFDGDDKAEDEDIKIVVNDGKVQVDVSSNGDIRSSSKKKKKKKQEDDDVGEEYWDAFHYSKHTRKIHQNAGGHIPHKLRHHMELHEALAKGDKDYISGFMQSMDTKYHLNDNDYSNDDSETDLHNRRLSTKTRKQLCQELVTCVEEWTLYDMVAWFYGPYVDDQGRLPKVDQKTGKTELQEGVKDVFGDMGVKNKITSLKAQVKRTKAAYANDQCTSLLGELYQNDNKDDFQIYHGAEVNMVCRAQGTTKYITIEEIRTKIGPFTADAIFEDLVTCSTNLGDSTFVNPEDHGPRIPSKPNTNAQGKPTSNETDAFYSFNEAGAIRSARQLDGKQIKFDEFKRLAPKCVKRVNQYYLKFYKEQESAIFKAKSAKKQDISYPKLQMVINHALRRIFIGVGATFDDAVLLCEISKGNFYSCPNVPDRRAWNDAFWHCRQHSADLTTFKVDGLYSGFQGGARDKAVKLSLGDAMPVGLACAYAEKKKRTPKKNVFPGWCCMDQPLDAQSWGEKYSCDLPDARSKCTTVAGGLSGLSQSACDVWSGTWCPYPRDCTSLKTCIETEINWANTSKPVKQGYLKYVDDAPKIKDTNSLDQCGDVRQYFGFKPDYPLDDEICEDVKLLRNFRHFNSLDKAFGLGGDPNGPTEQKDLSPPNKHLLPYEAFLAYQITMTSLGGLRIALWAVEKILIGFQCPGDCTGVGQTACAAAANSVAGKAVYVGTTIDAALEVMDAMAPKPTYWNNFETYYQIQRLYDNMVIINDGIKNTLRDVHNKCGQKSTGRLLLEEGISVAKFSGCDGYDQDEDGVIDNCEEDFTPPELVVPHHLRVSPVALQSSEAAFASEKVFRNTSFAKSFLQRSLDMTDDCAPSSSLELNLTEVDMTSECASTIRATPMQLCSGIASAGESMDFNLHIDRTPPTVECGFPASRALPRNSKTLLLEEDEEDDQLVDTGFYCKINDCCSKSVQVTVTVNSNEYENGEMTMTLKLKNGFEVLVSPSSCRGKKSRGHKGLCRTRNHQSNVSPGRLYQITVTATDAAGWTTDDVGQVIVVPKSSGVDKLRHSSASRSLSAGEQKILTEMKSTTADYELGQTSFELKAGL